MIKNYFKYLSSNQEDKEFLLRLKQLLGFYPGNIELYRQAFRHKSAAEKIKDNFKNSNERLEYLGDAVLGSIVAEFLFKKYPYKNEGFLTKLRSRLVSRQHINQLSAKIGVDELVNIADRRKNGFRTAGGNALEALLGAIYLDQGYTCTKNFVLNRLFGLHVDIREIEENDTDFKSKVVEWGQRERKSVRFEFDGEEGPQHARHYKVSLLVDGAAVSAGEGHSKKIAEQQAAQRFCEKENLS